MGKGYFDRTDPNVLDAIADSLMNGLPIRRTRPDVIITIPAHNEEGHIAKCIEAIAGQRTVYNRNVGTDRFEILILCHNCTDMTYANSLASVSRYPGMNVGILQTNRPEVNNVGAVRRVLMRIASQRTVPGKGFIAMTDADSVVHPYWIANILGYIGSGHGLICGKIEIDTKTSSKFVKEALTVKMRYEKMMVALMDDHIPDLSNPMPRHMNNSGPNMAVRTDVYISMGGIDALGFCEDIAFYNKVIYAGHSVRHCPMTIVRTSGRTEPRAPWGFGAELSIWNGKDAQMPSAEGLEALLERIRIYKALLSYAEYKEEFHLRDVLHRSEMNREEILFYIGEFPTDRALMLKMEKYLDGSKSWRRRYPKIDIRTACREIEDYVALSPEALSQISVR